MVGNYQTSDDIVAYIKKLEERIGVLEKCNPLNNGTIDEGGLLVKGGGRVTTIDGTTGAQTQFGQGQLAIWQDVINRPNAYGLIYCDPSSSNNLFRIFPPHDSGTGLENSVTLQGRGPTSAGNFWVYTDGSLNLNGVTGTSITDASNITLNAPELRIYSLPTDSTPDYTLGLNTTGGIPVMVLVTSSKRYKQDIETAALDLDAVLNIRPVTFHDIADVQKLGADAPVNFGVIAEELHALGLGDLLVTYKDGVPDAVKYDRIAVALIPIIKHQAAQIAELTKRVAILEVL